MIIVTWIIFQVTDATQNCLIFDSENVLAHIDTPLKLCKVGMVMIDLYQDIFNVNKYDLLKMF